jgi:hypothetical protein
VALGLKAIEQGYGVYFVRAHDLLEDLRRAQAEHRLDRRMRVYLAPRVLIIDEFGVWPYDRLAATALFLPDLLSVRAGIHHPDEQQGVRGVGRRLGRLRRRHGDSRPAVASQPRAEYPRESYRLREKKRAGLFGTHKADEAKEH